MTDDIIATKLNAPYGLAWYATDAALRFMVGCELPYAVELNRLADAVIRGADFLNDDDRLRASVDALAPADRVALNRLMAETSILQPESQLPKDAVQELSDALTYHWPKDFGFENPAAARAALGDAVVDTIDKFVDTKAEGFWKRDALAADIDKSVLSEKDMRIIAAFGAGSAMDELAGQVSGFVDTELLRASLRARDLRLPPKAVARLEAGLNKMRHSIRTDWPPVSLTEWLT